MQIEKPFNAFSDWLKNYYGFPVRKVILNSGQGCPNRDGTLSTEGCYFCDEYLAGPPPQFYEGKSVAEQLSEQISKMDEWAKEPQKYIAYFQAGSNTHGDLGKLHQIFMMAAAHPKVVSGSIGTRPDCIDDARLDIIEQAFWEKDVWIELGIQTAHDHTLKLINRNHKFSDSAAAINRIKKHNFGICAHLILGLPGETIDDMRATIDAMNAFGVHAIKFHPLSITRGSRMELMWKTGEVKLLDRDEYVDLVIDLLQRLSPKTIIQRLSGGGQPEVHIAPDWAPQSAPVIQQIIDKMNAEGIKQGTLYK